MNVSRKSKRADARSKRAVAVTAVVPSDWEQSRMLLDYSQVQKITGISRQQLYRLSKEGVFPKPVKVTRNRVRFWSSDVQAYLEAAAKGNV